MLERFATFNDYVREYELQRSEGVLLRYLSDAYKTLAQTVPESYRDEALEEELQSLRRTVREADSSLIDEWERLQRTEAPATAVSESGGPQGSAAKAVSARIRSELHRLLKALADRAWEDALACLAPGQDWTAETLEAELAPYFAAHERIVLTPEARRPTMAVVRQDAPVAGKPARRSSPPMARPTGCWTVRSPSPDRYRRARSSPCVGSASEAGLPGRSPGPQVSNTSSCLVVRRDS